MRVYVHKTRENAFNGDGGIFGGGSIKKRDIIMSGRKEGERKEGKLQMDFVVGPNVKSSSIDCN